MKKAMTISGFVRNFARMKRAATNGAEVLIRDRNGRRFVFRAQGAGPSLAEQLTDLQGALRTKTPSKSLLGFGRNRLSPPAQ